MDTFFLQKYNELVENKLDNKLDNTIFFRSKDEYIDKLINNLFCEIDLNLKKTMQNKKKTSIITGVYKVYNTDNTVNPNNIIIDCNALDLNNTDLLLINNQYCFVYDKITSEKINIQLVDIKSKIEIQQVIYKICNYKKFYRIYQSIINSNRTLLRNLYNPMEKLTKLTKSRVKSDFWNQEQINILSSIIKHTENKKIHVIDGEDKTGKSTLILGLIQNYFTRYEDIKLLITSSNKNELTNLAQRLISQKTTLLPDNKWILIIADENYIDSSLHFFLISKYVSRYRETLLYIDTEFKKIQKNNLDISPIIMNILNKLEELPFEPYSHKNTTISELLKSDNNLNDIINQSQLIIDKWKNPLYINNRLLNACSIVISTITSSGCPSMDMYKNNVIMIDDAHEASELEALIPLQDTTEQTLLFGNSKRINVKNTLFERLIKGGISVHRMTNSYNL